MTDAAAIRSEFDQEGPWVRTCAKDLQSVLANRSVIEVAPVVVGKLRSCV